MRRILDTQARCSELDRSLLIELLTSPTAIRPMESRPEIEILQRANRLAGISSTLTNVADKALTSIFDQVLLHLPETRPPSAYHDTPWSNPSNVFPVKPEQVQLNRMDLFKCFLDAFTDLFQTAINSQALYAGTMSLVDEYLWAIPAHEANPDVPLSEVLRLNSALTACLYQCAQSITEPDTGTPLTLLAGDLSGIQGYVFGITEGGKGAEGTGRRLRSRSLLVQLLAETGVQEVLRIYDLPPANILMASGGKFYVLWPGLADNAAKVRTLQRKFDQWLLKELNGEIGLALAHVPVSEHEFTSDFGQVLNRVEEELRRAKHRRLGAVLQDANDWREGEFLLQAEFDDYGICRSCAKFPAASHEGLCHHCDLDAKVGSRIRDAKCLAFYHNPESPNNLAVLGSHITILTTQAEPVGEPYLLLQLGGEVKPSASIPTLWRPSAPYVNADLRFIPMAQTVEGRELLGYLKADVDSLGAILQWGLKRENGDHLDTPARLSTLSRHLDRFWGLWLRNHLAQNYQEGYTVFAGGDDLFVIGPWDIITQLTGDLQGAFSRFVNHNPDITLSAGLALVKPQYPLARAAVEAEDLLEQAKYDPAMERKASKGKEAKGRDQIALLGDVLTWDTYKLALKERDALQRASPRSAFLYHLLQYAEMWRKFRLEDDTSGLRFQPMLAHNVTRNVDPRRQPDLRHWAKRLTRIPLDSEAQAVLDHLGLISALVIFAQQSGKE